MKFNITERVEGYLIHEIEAKNMEDAEIKTRSILSKEFITLKNVKSEVHNITLHREAINELN